jgi:histidinol phosphatase-like PHP family hydrolase
VINLHNHSTWSDGKYTPTQLVEMGRQSGLTHIGISDHFYTQKMFESRTFVDIDQLDDYTSDLRRVASQFAGQIGVLTGIEVDWSARAHTKLSALWNKMDDLDYVLFEYVDDHNWHGYSLESLLTIRPQIPIPVGLAHNHLCENFCAYYTIEELVHILQESDIFVELSTNPLTMYRTDSDSDNAHLWRAFAESEVRFSIGSDTHGFAADVARTEGAYRFLQRKGLADHLITEQWDSTSQRWMAPETIAVPRATPYLQRQHKWLSPRAL